MKTQIHGGDIYRNRNVLDFSSNLNPLGPPQRVLEALTNSLEHIQYYPDIFCTELREALHVQEGVPTEQIICGNGAAELIFSIVQASGPKKALLQSPTFAEYEQALKVIDCQIVYEESKEGFQLDERIVEQITEELDMIVLCNPNNPTGLLVEPELMKRIYRKCVEKHVLLVVDECFQDFLEDSQTHTLKPYLKESKYLFILKAFTKCYAMAGLRLGYGMTENMQLLEQMQQVTQPWNVSVLAQVAGVAALKEKAYVRQAMKMIQEERRFLKGAMRELGLEVYESRANYIFFRGPRDLYEKCLEQGILIRDCGNYRGLTKGYYRIAVKTHQDNARLIQVLAQLGNKNEINQN